MSNINQVPQNFFPVWYTAEDIILWGAIDTICEWREVPLPAKNVYFNGHIFKNMLLITLQFAHRIWKYLKYAFLKWLTFVWKISDYSQNYLGLPNLGPPKSGCLGQVVFS